MKEAFKDRQAARLKKKDFEKSFHEHYFASVAEQDQMPLESFYHPKNCKGKSRNSPKTINACYIDNISRSRSFVSDFLGFLSTCLEAEYLDSITSKIDSLIQRWDDEYSHSKLKDLAVEEICGYIEKNKKCKLPWTLKEVRDAINAVQKLFEQT
jgi:hypothetical protein